MPDNYEPTSWATGEVISANNLNKIEDELSLLDPVARPKVGAEAIYLQANSKVYKITIDTEGKLKVEEAQ